VIRPSSATARERTRLAGDRTILTACALSAVLIKVGAVRERVPDLVAGVLLAVVALLAFLRPLWSSPRRLALMSALVALSSALVAVEALR
jgi:hypothetical protein